MTQSTPLMLPITLAPERDVIPHSYVLHRHSQLCRACGTLHQWSAIYAKTHLRSRTGAGKYVTNLRPVVQPEWNLPIEILPAAQQSIPFCLKCINDSTLAHLPSPPIPDKVVAIARDQPAAKPPTSKRKTIDDLLAELKL